MKNKGGRPKIIIDRTTFEGLCKIQATKNEICSVFSCDEKTLTRWCKETYNQGFSDVFPQKAEAGKASLRRLQFKAAETGNTTMLVWLGKQYLGQTDKNELTHDGSLDIKVSYD